MIEETKVALSAEDVCQVLRDVVQGSRQMVRTCAQTWNEVYAGNFVFDVEGWRITIFNDCNELDYCDECVSPEGRRWSFDSRSKDVADPISLLSAWEHQTLEALLKEL